MKDVTVIRSIPVLHEGKNLYPHYFSLVTCTPREFIRHMTSDFDLCKVDLDMQSSCRVLEDLSRPSLAQDGLA